MPRPRGTPLVVLASKLRAPALASSERSAAVSSSVLAVAVVVVVRSVGLVQRRHRGEATMVDSLHLPPATAGPPASDPAAAEEMKPGSAPSPGPSAVCTRGISRVQRPPQGEGLGKGAVIADLAGEETAGAAVEGVAKGAGEGDGGREGGEADAAGAVAAARGALSAALTQQQSSGLRMRRRENALYSPQIAKLPWTPTWSCRCLESAKQGSSEAPEAAEEMITVAAIVASILLPHFFFQDARIPLFFRTAPSSCQCPIEFNLCLRVQIIAYASYIRIIRRGRNGISLLYPSECVLRRRPSAGRREKKCERERRRRRRRRQPFFDLLSALVSLLASISLSLSLSLVHSRFRRVPSR